MPRSIKRASLTEQASEAIVELIAERNLKAGDSLPGSGELAGMLDVSVPVVREAMAGLAAIGLLERHQGRESTVATPDSSHLSRLFALRVAGSAIDDEQLQRFREIVEVGNARLAARNRTPESLAAIDEAMTVLAGVENADDLHRADVAFHAAVAQAADNDLCQLVLESLEPLLQRLRRRVWGGWVGQGGGFEPIAQAHRRILEAIREGDEAGAGAAMTEHLDQARTGLEAAIRDGEQPVDPRAGFPGA
ncbi:FadR/GntR family transcriptional regulator [Homoserinibacter sp. YIM 151385]|uniref:FadR/GntR family transcriptional regulator n=1 Tax=Homoserinibacter sp. YIM 151385 TaxID=2985506 RepID=UPI0022F05B34|nr:FCD domain-containing protein [Homoserinibacter sp. YIM 151385]WBU37522.1 FCD domain-containing protein [Homoserinibacter sp. YIM 151385]